MDEPLHHHLPRQGADDRRGEPGGHQAQAEDGRGRFAKQRLQCQVGLIQFADAAMAVEVEGCRRGRHHRQVHETGDRHGDSNV